MVCGGFPWAKGSGCPKFDSGWCFISTSWRKEKRRKEKRKEEKKSPWGRRAPQC
jgi:hypothetical protein